MRFIQLCHFERYRSPVAVGFYAFPLVAGSRVFPIFSRSPVIIYATLHRVL